jgi:Isoprenylcysteine carboxyl methyltransferase (ICMT) family
MRVLVHVFRANAHEERRDSFSPRSRFVRKLTQNLSPFRNQIASLSVSKPMFGTNMISSAALRLRNPAFIPAKVLSDSRRHPDHASRRSAPAGWIERRPGIQRAAANHDRGMAEMKLKVWIKLGEYFLFFAGLLFGPSGTLAWPAAWACLILFFGPLLLITRALARDCPALLDERLKPLIQKGQPLWDKIIMASFVALLAFWLILMGVDAGRFRWSAMPAGLQVNPFLANVVKIQTGRGHQVVTNGPYGYVRHPFYAAMLVLLPSAALMLGSWFGVAATILLAGALILRTALEDRELHRRLGGYADYAGRVRYRLVPWLW